MFRLILIAFFAFSPLLFACSGHALDEPIGSTDAGTTRTVVHCGTWDGTSATNVDADLLVDGAHAVAVFAPCDDAHTLLSRCAWSAVETPHGGVMHWDEDNGRETSCHAKWGPAVLSAEVCIYATCKE